MSGPSDAPHGRKRRRWCQFRLAHLLLAMVIIAVLVVILQPQIERGLDWLRNLIAAQPVPAELDTSELTVVLKADGAISLDGQTLTAAQLSAALQAAFERHPPSRRVRILCDPAVPYEKLMSVLDIVTKAGYTEISIEPKTTGSVTR